MQAQAEFDPTAAEQLAAVMPRLEGFRATIYEHPEAEVETDIRRIRQVRTGTCTPALAQQAVWECFGLKSVYGGTGGHGPRRTLGKAF